MGWWVEALHKKKMYDTKIKQRLRWFFKKVIEKTFIFSEINGQFFFPKDGQCWLKMR